MPDDVAAAARSLGKFYMPTRYPDALGGMSPTSAYAEADARDALQAASAVYQHAVARLRYSQTILTKFDHSGP